MDEIKISVLVPARPNSVMLSRFMMSYFTKTADTVNTELLVMVSRKDEWNLDLFEFFDGFASFHFEDGLAGQGGHHTYLNELLKHSTGDWIAHLCDDMSIVHDDWDDVVRRFIRNNDLDSRKAYQLIPGMVIPGACVHILSRGYVNITGHMAGCGNTDSWNNTVLEGLPHDIWAERRREIMFSGNTPVLFDEYSNDPEYQPLIRFRSKDPRLAEGNREKRQDVWGTPYTIAGLEAEAQKLLHAIEHEGK